MSSPRPARYLYGVVDVDGPPVAVVGLDDAPVESVGHGDVAALITPTEDDEVLPRRPALLAHTRVLDEAIAGGPVLPARFGTVLPDVDSLLENVLVARHDALRDELARLGDAVEFRLRGEYDESKILARIIHQDREVARLRERASGYEDRIRLGERVTANLRQLADDDSRHVREALQTVARDVRVHDAAGALELPRLSFLVGRDDAEGFELAVQRLDELDGALSLRAAGPLAPHSFVEVMGVDPS